MQFPTGEISIQPGYLDFMQNMDLDDEGEIEVWQEKDDLPLTEKTPSSKNREELIDNFTKFISLIEKMNKSTEKIDQICNNARQKSGKLARTEWKFRYSKNIYSVH